MKTYIVVKKFTSGMLKGIEFEEKTNVKFELNKTYKGICGCSSYKIISMKEI